MVVSLVAGALCTTAFVTRSSAATAPVSWWGFATPSRNIVCNFGYLGTKSLSCVVFSAARVEQGQKVWTLPARGRPHVRFVVGNIGTEVPVLRYGRSWRRNSLSCISRRTGLTCRNRAGHGFTLSRERQQLF